MFVYPFSFSWVIFLTAFLIESTHNNSRVSNRYLTTCYLPSGYPSHSSCSCYPCFSLWLRSRSAVCAKGPFTLSLLCRMLELLCNLQVINLDSSSIYCTAILIMLFRGAILVPISYSVYVSLIQSRVDFSYCSLLTEWQSRGPAPLIGWELGIPGRRRRRS